MSAVYAPVHKVHKEIFQFDLEELDWPAESPDLNYTRHLWDELKDYRPRITNALVAEWEEIPAARFLKS